MEHGASGRGEGKKQVLRFAQDDLGRMRWIGVTCLLALTLLLPRSAGAQDRGAAALGDLIRGLGTTARVLVIAAHPDDEDTQLITWLARGRQVETAYLSLTRGDGGQNLIGNELGEALGAIRTEELLAARRVDGGHQYFSRAYDFGFSKTADETYLHWPKDSILDDVVRVVRAFRPHVIVAVFSGTPRDGHGHHQVSGLLAREVFERSADTTRFPRAVFGAPWTIQKYYRGARFTQADATLKFDVGEYNPLMGRGYGELSGESRSQHKSQGFGVLQRRGELIDMVRREGTRVNAATPADKEASIFDGVDTTWSRLRGAVRDARQRALLDSMAPLLARARTKLDLFAPASVTPLLDTIARLADALCPRAEQAASACRTPAGLAGDGDLARVLDVLDERLDRAHELASGLALEAVVNRSVVAANDSVAITVTLYNRGADAVVVTGVSGPGASAPRAPATVEAGKAFTTQLTVRTSTLTAPYWLSTPRAGDIFSVASDIGGDDRHPAALRATVTVRAGASSIDLTAPVTFRYADPVKGEIQRPATVAPAVTLTLGSRTEFAPANRAFTRSVRVTLRSAARDTQQVRLALTLPVGIVADSAERTVTLPPGAERSVDVAIRGRLAPGRHEVKAAAIVGSARYETGYTAVEYDHIRPQNLYRPAMLVLQAVDLVLPSRANIAYVPGVGDNVAPALAQLGFAVTIVEPEKLASTKLDDYAAVVIGPRAFEASAVLLAQAPLINAYAARGGTVVTQYGQFEMARPGVLPYGVTLTRPAARVTIEEAPITVLDAAHPLLNKPNRIGVADFAGWVQERGLYMPSTFDPAWTPLLEMNDPNEPANRGGLLVARTGKGSYVYTTLALFRQLPAGNVGAARLFANLIAAGQAPKVTP